LENVSMGVAYSQTELLMQISPTLVFDAGTNPNPYPAAQTLTIDLPATESAVLSATASAQLLP